MVRTYGLPQTPQSDLAPCSHMDTQARAGLSLTTHKWTPHDRRAGSGPDLPGGYPGENALVLSAEIWSPTPGLERLPAGAHRLPVQNFYLRRPKARMEWVERLLGPTNGFFGSIVACLKYHGSTPRRQTESRNG